MQGDQQGSPRFNEAMVLLERIREGSATDRETLLEYLRQQANSSPDIAHNSEDWNLYALGLREAGRFDEAIEIYNRLLQAIPYGDVYRCNLASTSIQARQFELARYHLRYLMEHGTTDQARLIWGQNGLEALENLLNESEASKQFRQLQIASLRESVSKGNASVDEYDKLAQFLIRMALQGSEDVSFDNIISILEKGRTAFSDSIEILEHLALCYARSGPKGRLNEVLQKLDEIKKKTPGQNPEVLQFLSRLDDSAIAAYHQQMLLRIQQLSEQAQSEDRALSEVAFTEFKHIVDTFPSNPRYRLAYALALAGANRYSEAIGQINPIIDLAGENSLIHFWLGQILWQCGDIERGQQHINLVTDYALQHAQSQDSTLRAEAIRDMKEIVAQCPSIPDFRMGYALTLALTGQFTDALEQANIVIETAEESHSTYVNLGEMFQYCNELEQAKHYFELALQCATNEEERQDALQAIAHVSGRIQS
jgi:tetratricopeptide (TPR) repeat protein